MAAGEVQSDAPNGAASPIGNNQQKNRRAKLGATVANAARPQAMSHRLTLRARDIGVACATILESGSGAILICSTVVLSQGGPTASVMEHGGNPALAGSTLVMEFSHFVPSD